GGRFAVLRAVVLVVRGVFLFLRDMAAAGMPAIALPMSIIGTFAVMYLFGYSLDNISLMALTLCVGFVVDDAIVMLENITRHIESGQTPLQATLEGSREIVFTIISMTLSLAAVFIPVLFMGGILGRLLHEFAVTIIAAVLISGFVSLTLTPMMCSRILKPHRADERHGRLYMAFERVFDGARHAYDVSLAWALARRRAVIVAFLAICVLTGVLFARAPKGFLPSEDAGQLTRSPYQDVMRSANVDELYHWAPLIEQKLRSLPGLVDVSSDLQITRPEVTVQIEREKASALGVSAQSIEMALNNAYGAHQVSTIYTSTNQYFVILELAPRYQPDPSVLPLLYVRSSTGALVPLNAVARLKFGVGPMQITHLGQLPSVTFSFDLRPGVALSQAIVQLQAGARELQVPATLTGSFSGTAQAYQASLEGMGILILLSIVVIY